MVKKSVFTQHLLAGLKVFGSYAIVVLIGVFMAGTFVEVFANNPMWFILYCVAFLIMYAMMAYGDMFNLAQKDRRNKKSDDSITLYKLKGLVIGSIAAIPLLITTILYLANNWAQNQVLNIAYRIAVGLYMAFHIYFADAYPIVYVLILGFTPVVCLLGYLAGYNNYYVSKLFVKLFPPPAKKPASRTTKKK